MIRFDDFKIVPSSRFARLMASMGEPRPQRLKRPPALPPQDVERWLWLWRLHPDVTDTAWPSLQERIKASYRLLFVRWLVDRERLTDDNRD